MLQTATLAPAPVDHFRPPSRPCEIITITFAQITTAVPVCQPPTLTTTTIAPTTMPPFPAAPASPSDPAQTNGLSNSAKSWLTVGLPIILITVVIITGWLVNRCTVNKQYDKLYPNRIKSVWWNPPVREKIVYRYVDVAEPCDGWRKMQAQQAAKNNPSGKAARTHGKDTVRTVASEGPTVPETAATKDGRHVGEPMSPRGTTG